MAAVMAGVEASSWLRARHGSACARLTPASSAHGGANCRDTRRRAEANSRAGSGRHEHEHGVPTVPIMPVGHNSARIVSCLGARRSAGTARYN